MDPRRSFARSDGNVVEIIPQRQEMALSDQAVWATERDYLDWNAAAYVGNPHSSKYDGLQSQTQSGSDLPHRKSRTSQGGDSQSSGFERDHDSVICSNRSREDIGRMFFKTKLCGKFQNGTCPFITNCNFAHGIDELRHPPPNWQEIVASQDDNRSMASEKKEESQIPCLMSYESGMENQRYYRVRHCKKFYTQDGCPFGNNCAFVHDEQSKTRESVAISLRPSYANDTGNSGDGSNQKPSNWKTRICNKWEVSNFCPFGSKCHFAHGSAELHRYGGGHVDAYARYAASAPSDLKQDRVHQKMPTDTVVASSVLAPRTDANNKVIFRPRPFNQRQEDSSVELRKGLNKINRIYGDWID